MDLDLGVKRIRELAEKRGLSINKMLVSELKLSKSVIDRMSAGSIPSADKMQAIASFLETSVAYILGMTDNPKPDNEPATHEGRPETRRQALIAELNTLMRDRTEEELERDLNVLLALEKRI